MNDDEERIRPLSDEEVLGYRSMLGEHMWFDDDNVAELLATIADRDRRLAEADKRIAGLEHYAEVLKDNATDADEHATTLLARLAEAEREIEYDHRLYAERGETMTRLLAERDAARTRVAALEAALRRWRAGVFDGELNADTDALLAGSALPPQESSDAE